MIFTVNKQSLSRTDSDVIVADTIEYLTATFTFSSDWNGFAKTAKFVNLDDSLTYTDILLIDDEITQSMELNLPVGIWSLSVRGILGDTRITTTTVTLDVKHSAIQGETPLSNLSTTEYEQLLDSVTSLQAQLDALIAITYSSSDVKVYSAKFVNEHFVPLAFLQPLYLHRTGVLSALLETTKPIVGSANYMQSTNTTNTTIDWNSATKLTVSRTIASPLTLIPHNSVSFNIAVAFSRDSECEYGARLFLNGTQISSNQTFGLKSYNGNNQYTEVYMLTGEVDVDSITEPLECPSGSVLYAELFKRQSSSVAQSTRYLCGVVVNELDRHSSISLKLG